MVKERWVREQRLNALGIVVAAVTGILASVTTLVATKMDSPPVVRNINNIVMPQAAQGVAPTPRGSPASDPEKSNVGAEPIQYSYYPVRAGYHCGSLPCTVAPAVVLDSVVDNPLVGDERGFFCAASHGRPVTDRLEVVPADIVTVRIYLNNDADDASLGDAASIAQNVHVSILIPTITHSWFNLVGLLRADNSIPGEMNDTTLIVGHQNLRLVYVPGSASFSHIVDGQQVTEPLSDSLVSAEGVGLGNIRAGTTNSGYITADIRVVAA